MIDICPAPSATARGPRRRWATRRDNPGLCLTYVNADGSYNVGVGRWAGTRWMDGAMSFTGMTTILGPNQASCTQPGDDNDGIHEPSSHHVGGVQVLMGDGAVRFISENINTGNPVGATNVIHGPSKFGVWGALGSAYGGETVGEF